MTKVKKKKWKKASKIDIENLSKGTLLLEPLSFSDCVYFTQLLSLTDCFEKYPDIPLKNEIFVEEDEDTNNLPP